MNKKIGTLHTADLRGHVASALFDSGVQLSVPRPIGYTTRKGELDLRASLKQY
jgi:hypothetical protein